MNELNPALIPELASLSPRWAWTRRDFMATSLAAGFALAVEPVSAQTIATDAKGLAAGEVRIPVKGLILSHIFSWTRGGFFANLFSCWLRAVTFPKTRLREFVRG